MSRAADLAGIYPQSLRTHMQKHYMAAVEEAANDALLERIAEYEVELLSAAEAAPAEVKPLYLTAIHNLRGLLKTNPSQQNLITALKTIQDITGMKQQQAILLGFARHHFKAVDRAPTPAALPQPLPAIPSAGETVEEAVIVE